MDKWVPAEVSVAAGRREGWGGGKETEVDADEDEKEFLGRSEVVIREAQSQSDAPGEKPESVRRELLPFARHQRTLTVLAGRLPPRKPQFLRSTARALVIVITKRNIYSLANPLRCMLCWSPALALLCQPEEPTVCHLLRLTFVQH